MASKIDEISGPHSHCDQCYNYNCEVDPQSGKSCSMLSCDLDCGAKFHKCKLSEHKILCPYERVACLSALCGCPMSVVRCLQVRHMQSCPAFVIQCGQKYRVEDWDAHFTSKKGDPLHDKVCMPILNRWRIERDRKKDHIDKVFDDIQELQQRKKDEKANKEKKESQEKSDAVDEADKSKTPLSAGDSALYPEPPITPISPEPPLTPLSPSDSDIISRMPMEIMEHLGQFLDGEGMYNLAKTSSYMFNVCTTLLDEKKGMVNLKWHKKDVGTWKIKEPMWEFASKEE
ncbi:uncharacterized protein [Antedon mediterranea]|uniref:uncharacterized protein n=1 Tax=Antedon mediterranea TaxID=105859 RepID=UPI003AF85BD9